MNKRTRETRLMKEQSFCKPFYLTTIDSKRIIQKQPPEVFCQKILKISQYSQENACVGVSV